MGDELIFVLVSSQFLALIGFLVYLVVDDMIKLNRRRYDSPPPCSEPFLVSEYYERMEKSALDIQKGQEPVDSIIVLWWGLDGLRLNESGELEWISRKEPEQTHLQSPVYHYETVCLYADNLVIEKGYRTPEDKIAALKAELEFLDGQAAQQEYITQFLDRVPRLNPYG